MRANLVVWYTSGLEPLTRVHMCKHAIAVVNFHMVGTSPGDVQAPIQLRPLPCILLRV